MNDRECLTQLIYQLEQQDKWVISYSQMQRYSASIQKMLLGAKLITEHSPISNVFCQGWF